MFNRADVKERGKIAFKANYWKCVVSALIITLIAGGSAFAGGSRTASQSQEKTQQINDAVNSMTEEQKTALGVVIMALAGVGMVLFALYTLLKIFVFNPLQVGCYRFFRENAVSTVADLSTLKAGFEVYKNSVITLFLRDLFTALWFCLFIIPGIVKIYSYRMVPFILRDHPEMSATEVITMSRHMMNGNKWDTFIFDLSYIGWYLLGGLTLGLVNMFWTDPYRQSANAYIYLELSGEGEPDAYAGGPYAGGPYSGGPYADGPFADGAAEAPSAEAEPDAAFVQVEPEIPAPAEPEILAAPAEPEILAAPAEPEILAAPTEPVAPAEPVIPAAPAEPVAPAESVIPAAPVEPEAPKTTE